MTTTNLIRTNFVTHYDDGNYDSTTLMNKDDEHIFQQEEWRSKKYLKLTDEEVLELSLKQLPDKDRYYLLQELEYRKLNEQALLKKRQTTKKEMRSKAWWKYLPILFALVFLIKRMFTSY